MAASQTKKQRSILCHIVLGVGEKVTTLPLALKEKSISKIILTHMRQSGRQRRWHDERLGIRLLASVASVASPDTPQKPVTGRRPFKKSTEGYALLIAARCLRRCA